MCMCVFVVAPCQTRSDIARHQCDIARLTRVLVAMTNGTKPK